MTSRDEETIHRLATDLETHAGFGEKRAGSAGDLATCDWIADRLRGLGYEVAIDAVDVPFFDAETAELQAGEARASVLPQPIVVPTGGMGVTGKLAVLHHAAEARRVEGAVAMVVAPYGRHATLAGPPIGPLVRAAAEGGAKAVVVVTTGPSGEAVALNAASDAPFVSMPVAILAPKDAEPFFAAAADGAMATLTVTGEGGRRETRNITAKRARGERWLGLSTPRSGWFQCSGERGTGTAVFLALAEWAAARFPDLSVFAINTGGHEYMFPGTHRVLAVAPPPARTLAWAHIGATLAAKDMHEWRGERMVLPSADPNRIVMATEPAMAAVRAGFRGLTGLETPLRVLKGAGELSTIVERGYETAFAVLGVHSWFHTRLDGLETVDAALLAPVLDAHKRAIETLVVPSAAPGRSAA